MPERTISLTTLKEIVSTVMYAAEADTLEIALQRIADASRDLVNARYAALGVPDGEGGLTHFVVSGLSSESIDRIAHPPVGKGLLGTIMNEREVIRLPHMTDDSRAVGFPAGHPPMDSLLGVPIQVGGQLFGMLYLTDRKDGEPFSLGDQWLVETMAGYAALAIAGTSLREKQQRLALLEERQRIGMELHDGIIQSLYALGMHIDLIRSGAGIPSERFQPVIDGLNSVIEEIRDYIMDLRRRADSEKSCHQLLDDVVTRLYIPSSMSVVINAPNRPLPLP
ncbi:MAG: GAF domain-containing protein, partial [Phototrophicaceae bacterium]